MTEGTSISRLRPSIPLPIRKKTMEDNNDKSRVLGRVLAVEEIKTVSGARQRPPMTTYEADTFFLFDNPQP